MWSVVDRNVVRRMPVHGSEPVEGYHWRILKEMGCLLLSI